MAFIPNAVPSTADSLAEAVAQLAAMRDTSQAKRDNFAAAVRSLGKVLGRDAASIPASIVGIDTLLKAIPFPKRQVSRKTVANIRSRVKTGLLLLRGHQKVPRALKLTGEWARLYDALPSARLRNGLSRLMRHASHQDLAPEAMSDAFLHSTLERLHDTTWSSNPLSYQRRTARLWNEAAASIPPWPQVQLTPVASPARLTHLPLSAFPASFVTDLEMYTRWLAGEDPLAAAARARPLKTTTIRLHREMLRIAASTLADVFNDRNQVSSLALLAKPMHTKVVLNRYLARAEGKSSAYLRTMAMVLVQMAKHQVPDDLEGVEELKGMLRRVESKLPKGLTEKNRHVVRQLGDPAMRQALIDLPRVLAKQARGGRHALPRRIQKFNIALAIQLLLVAPIRLQNLRDLHLDKQLTWPNGPQGKIYLALEHWETKNGESQEYEIPDHAKALLEEYRDRYRALCKPKTSALFVQSTGSPVTAAALRDGITKAIQRELGIHMTPHQFRHFAATVILDANPGAYAVVADLLGHKNLKTTIGFYAGRRTRQAAQVYDALLRTPATSSKDPVDA